MRSSVELLALNYLRVSTSIGVGLAVLRKLEARTECPVCKGISFFRGEISSRLGFDSHTRAGQARLKVKACRAPGAGIWEYGSLGVKITEDAHG